MLWPFFVLNVLYLGILSQLINNSETRRIHTCLRDHQTVLWGTESVLWQGGNLTGIMLKAESRITMSVRSIESTEEFNAEGNSDRDWTPKGRNKKVKSHTQLHTVRRCCINLPNLSKKNKNNKKNCTNNGIFRQYNSPQNHINSWGFFFFFFLTLKISAGTPLLLFSKCLSDKGKGLTVWGFRFQTWSISRATSENCALWSEASILFDWL